MTPWTVACQAPLSMGFSRQEHWNGLPFPFLGDLPDPGIEPGSPAFQADSLLIGSFILFYLFIFFHLFLLVGGSLLYNIVVVFFLPYIDMNQPWIYMC